MRRALARVAEAPRAEPVGGASRRARARQFCRVLASLNWPRFGTRSVALCRSGCRARGENLPRSNGLFDRGSLQGARRCDASDAAKLLCEAVVKRLGIAAHRATTRVTAGRLARDGGQTAAVGYPPNEVSRRSRALRAVRVSPHPQLKANVRPTDNGLRGQEKRGDFFGNRD